jgi:hypothetical protein
MLVRAGGAVFTNQMKHSSILYLRKALLALSHFISSAKSFNAQSMPTTGVANIRNCTTGE